MHGASCDGENNAGVIRLIQWVKNVVCTVRSKVMKTMQMLEFYVVSFGVSKVKQLALKQGLV